jgi:hypothetical protein
MPEFVPAFFIGGLCWSAGGCVLLLPAQRQVGHPQKDQNACQASGA